VFVQVRVRLVVSCLLALASGCGSERECSSEFSAGLSFLPDQECPTDSATAVAMLTAQNDWSEPSRPKETITATLAEVRSSSALTICWYDLGDGHICSPGERERALEAAKACTETPSLALASREWTTACGDEEGVLLGGDIFVMDDPEQPVSCPTDGTGWSDNPFVGSDVYPVCKTCDYVVTDAWECRGGGVGAVGFAP